MSTDQPNGCALPAQPGTRYDGEPLFEALVFGFVCSTKEWNGQHQEPGTPDAGTETRAELAGYFEQWLAQLDDFEVGDRVMFCPGGDVATAVRVGAPVFMHGTVVESTPQVIRVRWDGSPAVGAFDADSFHKLQAEPRPASAR